MDKTAVIDAHHHLWRYTLGEYGWIDESMQLLRRDFLPADLTVEMATAGVDGSIVVQARQTTAAPLTESTQVLFVHETASVESVEREFHSVQWISKSGFWDFATCC